MKASGWFSRNIIFVLLLILAVSNLALILSYSVGINNFYLASKIIAIYGAVLLMWGFVCVLLNPLILLITKKINIYKLGSSRYLLLLFFICVEAVYMYSIFIERTTIKKDECALLNASICFIAPEKNQALTKIDHSKSTTEQQALLINALVQARIAANEKYKAALNNIAIEGERLNKRMANDFSAVNLVTEEGVNNAELFIPEYRNYVTEKNNTLLAYQEDITKNLSSCDINANEFWDSYDKTKVEGKNLIDFLFIADNQILDLMTNMLVFIKNNLSHAAVINNNIIFDEASLNIQYKSFITKINELANKENEILYRIQNKKDDSINEMKSEIKGEVVK